jgi:hypothetical protein
MRYHGQADGGHMKKRFAALIALLLPPFTALAQDSFEVLESRVTTAVKDKQPVDTATTFSTGDHAYLWLKLAPEGSPQMRVRWSLDGDQVWISEPSTVQLGRTWMYKTIHAPGSWTAEVLDEQGEVKATATFTATGEATAAAASAPVAAAASPAPASSPTPAPSATPASAAEPAPPSGTADMIATRTADGQIRFEPKPGTEAPAPAPAPAASSAPTPAPSPAVASAAESDGAPSPVSVVELKLTLRVEDRQPVSPGTNFAAGDRVYAWVKLRVEPDEAWIRVRWSRGGEVISTSDTVTVRHASGWRTWMSTEVDAGSWKVEILGEDDRVLDTASFTVN